RLRRDGDGRRAAGRHRRRAGAGRREAGGRRLKTFRRRKVLVAPLADGDSFRIRKVSELPVSLTLYYHPLASLCHKVLIALYENEVEFAGEMVDLMDPGSATAFLEAWP